jgi:hypothetical protein
MEYTHKSLERKDVLKKYKGGSMGVRKVMENIRGTSCDSYTLLWGKGMFARGTFFHNNVVSVCTYRVRWRNKACIRERSTERDLCGYRVARQQT